MKNLILSFILAFTPVITFADVSAQMLDTKDTLQTKLESANEWVEGGYEIYFDVTDRDGGFKISDSIELLTDSDVKSLKSESTLFIGISNDDLQSYLAREKTITELFMTGLLVVDFERLGELQESLKKFERLFLKIPKKESDGWCC